MYKHHMLLNTLVHLYASTGSDIVLQATPFNFCEKEEIEGCGLRDQACDQITHSECQLVFCSVTEFQNGGNVPKVFIMELHEVHIKVGTVFFHSIFVCMDVQTQQLV